MGKACIRATERTGIYPRRARVFRPACEMARAPTETTFDHR
jgi:hypothetical protein